MFAKGSDLSSRMRLAVKATLGPKDERLTSSASSRCRQEDVRPRLHRRKAPPWSCRRHSMGPPLGSAPRKLSRP